MTEESPGPQYGHFHWMADLFAVGLELSLGCLRLLVPRLDLMSPDARKAFDYWWERHRRHADQLEPVLETVIPHREELRQAFGDPIGTWNPAIDAIYELVGDPK